MLRAPVSLTHTHFFAGIGHNRVWVSFVPWVAQRKRFCEAEAVWPQHSRSQRLQLLSLSWGLGGMSHPNPPHLHRAVKFSTCYYLTRELTEHLRRQRHCQLHPKDLSPALSSLCNSICLSVSFSYSLPLSLRVSPLRKAEERLAILGMVGWRGGIMSPKCVRERPAQDQ